MHATGRAKGPDLGEADRRLCREIEEELARGSRAAGGHLVCRLGCTACCLGPFEITSLDAARLGAGLAELERRSPERADAVAARAREQWADMREAFPGDAASGELDADESAREGFFARFAAAPCPALDPSTGACDLYDHRPISCRTYGLPVRCAERVLAPCELNFRGAAEAEVAAATVEPDPGDREGELLSRLGGGDTIVAAALVRGPAVHPWA